MTSAKTKTVRQKPRRRRKPSAAAPLTGSRPPAPPAPAGDLFPGVGGAAAFHLGPVATAEELYAITGRTDAELRAIASQVRPEEGAKGGPPQTWLPKPVRGKYHTMKTLAGLRAYDEHRLSAEKTGGLPRTFASMQDCEARLRFPVEMQQFARRNGCAAFEASNRVQREPLSEYFFPIFKKIFGAGGVTIKGIEGMEQLDADLELAKLREAQRQKLEDDTAIRRRQMLMLPVVEELIWEKGLAPLRSALLNYEKVTGAQLKTMLLSLGLKPADAERAVAVAVAGVQTPIKHIRELIPAKLEAEEQKKAA